MLLPVVEKKHKMPEQSPKERIKNFNEVALGYSKETAIAEAKRCLQCKKPTCIDGCPVGINIPKFIKYTAEGKFEEGILSLKEQNSLPAICGRVCPQERQCEKTCVLGKKYEPVAIGRIERFLADWEYENSDSNTKSPSQVSKMSNKMPDKNGKKVAIVGSGPAGLTCAGELVKMGYSVTIFESLHIPGGVLSYGIPEFRLPKEIVRREIEYLQKLGVEIKCNYLIGKTLTIDELFSEGYSAVFVGTGAGLPNFMNIPGENLNGVYSANEFLTRVNLMKAYKFPEYDTPIRLGKRVVTVGAGNVAMDAARTALRLGALESYIVYRRSEAEIPARHEEVEHAKEEGVKFELLTNPIRLIGDEKGWVKKVVCQRQKLGEPDTSGRRRPIPIEGSEFEIEVDTVIMAIGTSPNPLVPNTTKGLKIGKHGTIEVDSFGRTSLKYVYAGGDITTGAATVIEAMGAGKKAAKAIDEDLKKM
ncbi:MAG: NADPH-dependent glutamate synthase [Thermoplasmata archaeon]